MEVFGVTQALGWGLQAQTYMWAGLPCKRLLQSW